MNGTLEAVEKELLKWEGYVEVPNNYTIFNDWYFGRKTAAPWCATWLSYCFYHAGLSLPASTGRGFAYTPSGAAWFQNRGRWTNKPKRGYLGFCDFPGDGVNRISHVLYVLKVLPDGGVVTIEGNTSSGKSGSQRDGGGVYRRIRHSGIVGYGMPEYKVIDVPSREIKKVEQEMRAIVKDESNNRHYFVTVDGKGQLCKDGTITGPILNQAIAAGFTYFKDPDGEWVKNLPEVG